MDQRSIAQNLLLKFPNLKITYLSSVNYTGYSNGVYNLYHEPYAYEAGFAAKYSIQDQINGNANLNFDPSKGTVLASWMAWGPYYWVDGLVPRSDGFVWSCQDSRFDGTHPSDPAGRLRASTTLMNFGRISCPTLCVKVWPSSASFCRWPSIRRPKISWKKTPAARLVMIAGPE